MANELIILVLLIIFVAILGSVVAFAGRRRMKAKLLIVEKDLRNPNVRPKKYWAIYDKNTDGINLYSSLFKPWKDTLIPPFKMDAYLHNGAIWCQRGATGNPEDNNIYPIHYTLVGKVGGAEFSNELAGAIRNTNHFIKACSNFRIGQNVEYTEHKKSGDNIVKGTITEIGYHGIEISYEKPYTDKNGTVLTKSEKVVIGEPNQIKNIKSETSEEDLATLHETPLGNFYSGDWIMHNFGLIPVDDVNVILEGQKSAVAQYNSKLDERRRARQSWAARHGAELLIITFFLVVIVSLIIFYSAFTTDITNIVAQAKGVAVAQPNAVSIIPLPKVSG